MDESRISEEDTVDAQVKSACRGVFVTFEGTDGVGKSTQVKLLSRHLESQGISCLCLHEPGHTELGERIRGLLLARDSAPISALSELFLFEAARAQLVGEVILPALDRGEVVLSDRFYDSTSAYQGYGRGIDPATIDRLNELACNGVVPDRTILLTLDAQCALERACAASPDGRADRMEGAGLAFQKRVQEGFESICAAEPQRVRKIDANGAPDEVAARVFSVLEDLFPGVPAPKREVE